MGSPQEHTMKKKLLASAIMLSTAFLMIPAHADFYDNTENSRERAGKCYRGARKPAVVADIQDMSTGSGKTAAQVKDAIIRAASANRWTVREDGGRLEATLNVRNKHRIVVDIPFDADKYSLLYKNSSNMNYAACEGERFIHPNYNVWVDRLNKSIQSELLAMPR